MITPMVSTVMIVRMMIRVTTAMLTITTSAMSTKTTITLGTMRNSSTANENKDVNNNEQS